MAHCGNFRIWVDYFDLSDRESESEERFSIDLVDEDMIWIRTEMISNNWQAILDYIEDHS